jgi:putative peptidoglycan lipid II flippase
MNFSMILSLLIDNFCFGFGGFRLVHWLIVGALIGGIIQLMIPLLTIFISGWNQRFDPDIPNLKSDMRDVWKLFFPGIFGAAIEQFNILISHTIAFSFCVQAVSLLYLFIRLVELPIDIFGWAIITVFFPIMVKVVSSKANSEIINKTFNVYLVALAWILLPSAIGIFVLKREIVSVFVEHEQLTSSDGYQALPIISVYCLSMIFSGISSLLIRGFHSLKDTKTPVYVGFVVLLTNVILALKFVRIFSILGLSIGIRLAMENAIATIVQTPRLFALLKTE